MSGLDKQLLGKNAEDLTLEKYLSEGFSLVAKNFQFYTKNQQGRQGEIDLIMLKDNKLHIVEVKARSNLRFGNPLEQITRFQMNRIYKTYLFFLKKNPVYQNKFCQIDISVVMDNKVQIVPNAYSF